MSLDVIVSAPRDAALSVRDRKRVDPHKIYPTMAAKRRKAAKLDKPYGLSYEWRMGYYGKRTRQRTVQWYTTEIARDQAYRLFEKRYAAESGRWYRDLRQEFRGNKGAK